MDAEQGRVIAAAFSNSKYWFSVTIPLNGKGHIETNLARRIVKRQLDRIFYRLFQGLNTFSAVI
jgi:hypothetical protein